jgi:hypothetical protein
MLIRPTHPACCPMCAGRHRPEEPHNRNALFYQLYFQQRHSRWPTWKDAMAHCPVAIQQAWQTQLSAYGIALEDTQP